MTLISTFYLGGKACIISGDTKKILTFFGKTFDLPGEKTKVHQISDRFIAAGGGFNVIFEYIIEELKKLSSNSAQEIANLLRELEKEIPERFKTTFMLYPDLFFGVQVIGFDENNGKMYDIAYSLGGEIKFAEVPLNKFNGSVIAPGDVSPALSRVGGINFKDHTNLTTVVEDLLHYSLHLHCELVKDFPDEISNTFCYHILALVDDQVMHFEGTTEL